MTVLLLRCAYTGLMVSSSARGSENSRVGGQYESRGFESENKGKVEGGETSLLNSVTVERRKEVSVVLCVPCKEQRVKKTKYSTVHFMPLSYIFYVLQLQMVLHRFN